jgi:hypothetical protein
MADDELKPEDWPGVHLAYDFVLASYDWTMRRLNAVEGRIQALMMFSVTLGITFPVLVASLVGGVDFQSSWFVLTLAAALFNLVTGTVARTWGRVKLLSLQTVCAEWLPYSEWEFKRRAVYWAGMHFEHNTNVVNKKGRVILLMTAAFLVEAVFMFVWGLSEAGAS